MLERFLVLWLLLLSLLAYVWPQCLPADWDPFLLTKPGLRYLFAVTMFAIGCLLPRDEIRQVFRRWPTVLGGTVVQYLSMPLLAYFFGRLFQLPTAELVGIVMVGCVPGAMASNVLTLAARGNVSYSVSLTTSATLLSPLVVPLTLYWLVGTKVDLDPADVFWELTWMVVGPVVLGHLLCRQFERLQQPMKVVGPIIANLTILWIIAVVVAANRERLASVQGPLLWALLVLNLGGYLAGFSGGGVLRLPDSMRRALTLEVGMQNAGLGTVLALRLFPDQPAAAIPPAFYTFGCMLTGAMLAKLWAMSPAQDSMESDRPLPQTCGTQSQE